MSEQTSQMRAEFEAWAKSAFLALGQPRGGTGYHYISCHTEDCWEAWQAAWNRRNWHECTGCTTPNDCRKCGCGVTRGLWLNGPEREATAPHGNDVSASLPLGEAVQPDTQAVPVDARPKIDANDLERMAKERPDESFLKGSGILKLIGGIRQLEAELRAVSAESQRYRWLRELMGRNLPNSWSQVQDLGSICAWRGWVEFDAAVDSAMNGPTDTRQPDKSPDSVDQAASGSQVQTSLPTGEKP